MNTKRLIRMVTLAVVLQMLPTAVVHAKSLTMVTYYPAPNAAYDRLRLVPRAAVGGTACDIGTLYVNQDDNNLIYYCAADGVDGEWTPFASTVWKQDGDDIYLDPSAAPAVKRVAIGTSTPDLKLTLTNDGGIIAKGTLGAGEVLSTSGAGTRFIWYPRKGAIRAGQVTGAQWNDGSIGLHSVAFGKNNTAAGDKSTVLGGEDNSTALEYTVIVGGLNNTILGSDATAPSVIVGGRNNVIAATGRGTIGGGFGNVVNSDDSVVVGGASNEAGCIDLTDPGTGNVDCLGGVNTVVGGENNRARYFDSTIVGGKDNLNASRNGTIVGGLSNTINGVVSFADTYRGSTITGGSNNTITTANYATITGGFGHTINQSYAAISGGQSNTASGDYARVGGGKSNTASGSHATVVGGELNVASGQHAFVGGGKTNTAAAIYSVVGGGQNNQVLASGQYGFVGGGLTNIASGLYSVVPGGATNVAAGDYSWASGRNVNVTGRHTFVWGHDATNPINVTQDDAFIIATGNVGIGTITPDATKKLHVVGSLRTDGNVTLTNPASAAGEPQLERVAAGTVGLDMAELFETSENVAMGDLLVVDETQQMKLKKSSVPYDKKIVGIVSGAPALLFEGDQMQVSPKPFTFKEGTKPPVALAGRVLCKVSLENGPIAAGDLLTSSSEPGHAMKATDPDKANAVIGKALEAFAGNSDGATTGMIKVLLMGQ